MADVQVGRKTLLITGCSSGIGYIAAKELAARGYQVCASARKSADVDRLGRDGLHAVQLDLEDSSSMDLALAELLEASDNQLYALVSNAAFELPGAVEDLSRDALRHQFETNLFGTIELVNKVLPIMRAQGSGRLIMMSSILGRIAMRYRGAYNASKYALEGICETLRLELAGSGIAVSMINPGPIESRFRSNSMNEADQYLDTAHSLHREAYARMRELAADPTGKAPYSLPAKAVVDQIIHALEARKPKLRYYVTKPAKVLSLLDRVLPESWMDRILRKL